RRRDQRLAARPGLREHDGRHRPAARDRRAAAVHLLGRFRAAGLDDGAGRAALLRPPGAGSGRGDRGPPELGAQLHQRAARTARTRPRERGRQVRPGAAHPRELVGPDREGRDGDEGHGQPRSEALPHLLPHPALGPRHRTLLPKVMMSSTTPRILLAGGGSAGHVSPLLATAAQITRRCPEAEILVLGTPQGLEADLVPAAGLELVTIDKVPFPRRPDGAALRFPGRFLGTLREVRGLMRERGIDVVAGFGGYVCPPAYLAAASLRRPLVVHEANRPPGLANRLGALRAKAVLTAFEGSSLPGARRIGMPMREAIAHLERAARRDEAVRSMGLDPARPVLLVTGGSLGAQRLNAAVAQAARTFVDAGAQILHVSGRGKAADLPELEGYRVLEYVTA